MKENVSGCFFSEHSVVKIIQNMLTITHINIRWKAEVMSCSRLLASRCYMYTVLACTYIY